MILKYSKWFDILELSNTYFENVSDLKGKLNYLHGTEPLLLFEIVLK